MSSKDDDAVKIADVVKVGTLGEGTQGTVWSAKRRSSRGKLVPYALKQRLIKKSDAAMRSTKTSSALREIEFYKKVANRHPDQFSRLYDWTVTEATPEMRSAFDAVKQYTHVLTTLSSRKEGVLKNVYHTLSRPQWLSMLSQVCYAIALVHEKGFSHGDVWEANIGFTRVPWARDVTVYRNSVPSLGYIWSIIDYGSVELDADDCEQETKRCLSYELDDMISLASGEDDAEQECGDDSVDTLGGEFKREVLGSVDGPSVRLAMKQTGLPMDKALALINLDAYVWHVCHKQRSAKVKAWIRRDALLHMAEAKASYSALALYFAKLTRESIRHGEGRSRY